MFSTLNGTYFSFYEQFLLFPQCFQKACFPVASKGVIVWEWVKSHPKIQGFIVSLTQNMNSIMRVPVTYLTFSIDIFGQIFLHDIDVD